MGLETRDDPRIRNGRYCCIWLNGPGSPAEHGILRKCTKKSAVVVLRLFPPFFIALTTCGGRSIFLFEKFTFLPFPLMSTVLFPEAPGQPGSTYVWTFPKSGAAVRWRLKRRARTLGTSEGAPGSGINLDNSARHEWKGLIMGWADNHRKTTIKSDQRLSESDRSTVEEMIDLINWSIC